MAGPQQHTPEETEHDVRTAHEALSRGDLPQALFHISSALGTDPTRPEWLATLHETLRRAPDPLGIVRLDEAKADFVAAAGRAYALAFVGRYAEALPLLADVVAVRPDVPFLVWGAQWLGTQGVAQSVPPEVITGRIVPALLRWIADCPPSTKDADPRKRNLDAAGYVFQVLRYYFPQDPHVLSGSAAVMRRLGQMQEAIACAEQARRVKNDWDAVVGLACALRDGGRLDAAVAAWREALQMRPDDASPLLDIGDTYLGANRFDEAIGAYQQVTAKEPGHAWAEPSAVFARFKKNGHPSDKALLAKLSEKSKRAWDLLAEIRPPAPYVNFLPGPGDATANGVRSVMDHIRQNPQASRGGTVNLTVTHPESPSVLTAFRLWADKIGVQVGLQLAVEKVQQPDPRVPKGQVDFVAWAYDDKTPRPALPPPDPRPAQAIATIAAEPFDLDAWEPAVRSLGGQMGAAWLQQIVCVMVHPPPIPAEIEDPFTWVQRVQIAAAMVIANLDSGWEASARKRALYSLAIGPVDWTCDAAIIALGWLARGDATIRSDVLGLFAWLEGQIPKDGFTCFEYPLACTWLQLPGLDGPTKARLEAWKKRIENPTPPPA